MGRSTQLALLWLGLVLAAPARQLPIRVYTTADGLPHNRANCIVQDTRGFLWFCTGFGLSRFDGYRFTNYGPEHGLPDRTVTAFLETRKGAYWAGTGPHRNRHVPGSVPSSARFSAGAHAVKPRRGAGPPSAPKRYLEGGQSLQGCDCSPGSRVPA